MSTAAKRQSAAPAAPNRQALFIVGVVIVVVVVVAAIAISLSGARSGDIDYASIPQSRTADGGFVLGDPNAPITVIEFADFGCPHCQEYHETMQSVISNFVVNGMAKFEYRIFPTAGGQLSYYTGQLLQCGEEQKAGSFWQGYKLMFDYAMTGRYTTDVGRLYANDLGLNYSQLLDCASTATQVQTDINFGSNNGVTGTPAVLVRYHDGAPQPLPGYDRGGPPYSAIASTIIAAQNS